ncbi:MAG: hypothetical protein HN719_09375 [Alphaproteobacteria bacterium]|jgi:hypothetical protein|nr:hypothetical protein [Alphaproteobacteria bacterium]
MPLKKFFITVSFFIIGIVVMDLVVSQIAKRVAPQWRNAVLEQDARILLTPYHHGLKPYADFTHKYGDLRAPFYTNSLGFRDGSPREVSLKPKGRRLLIIGDSITEGVGVPYEETFAGIIDRELKKDGIETLNAGVQSYAHQIYYSKVAYFIEKRNLEVTDVAVFVDIGDVANDVTQYETDENGNVVRVEKNCRYGIGCQMRPMKRFKFWLKDNSILYRSYKVLKAYRREIKARSKVTTPLASATNVPGGMWTFDEKEYNDYGIKGLAVAGDAMSKLREFLSKRNIGMTVVVYPWPDQIVQKDLDSRQVKFWRNWATENNAQFLNLFPSFIDGRPAKEVYEKYFIPHDNHFNEQGHEMVAEKFLAQWNK